MKQNGSEQDRFAALERGGHRPSGTQAPGSVRATNDLARLVAEADELAEVVVPPGVYRARIMITRSVTLVGGRWGDVFIQGEGGAPAIEVRAPGARVTLKRLSIERGAGGAGGGVAVHAVRDLVLEECALTRNIAPGLGGGALYARAGRVEVRRSILRDNQARLGGALLVEGEAEVALDGCIIAGNSALSGGGVAVDGSGVVSAVHCTFADNHSSAPRPTGDLFALLDAAARLRVQSSIVAALRGYVAVENRAFARGGLEVDHSLLPPGLPRELFADLGGNIVGEPRFEPSSYAPGPRSPSIGLASWDRARAGETDLLGHPRVRSGLVDAGALVHVGRARRLRRPSSARPDRRAPAAGL